VTPDQTRQLLRLLTAAWPREPLSDETAALWSAALAAIDHSDAMGAAGQLIAESKYFPSMAEFREHVTATRRARQHHQAIEHGLPRPPTDTPNPQRFAEIMTDLRDQLALRRGTGNHWHGGPHPCPACQAP
jgi:hypothetical protein